MRPRRTGGRRDALAGIVPQFHVERSTAQARCSTPFLFALSAATGATCAASAVSFPCPLIACAAVNLYGAASLTACACARQCSSGVHWRALDVYSKKPSSV